MQAVYLGENNVKQTFQWEGDFGTLKRRDLLLKQMLPE